MHMCNLFVHSENYSDISRSLWLLKIDEAQVNNDNVTIDCSTSIKYQSSLTEADNGKGEVTNTKIAVPIKYESNG